MATATGAPSPAATATVGSRPPAPTTTPLPSDPAAFLAYVRSLAVPTRDLADLARRLNPQSVATATSVAAGIPRTEGSRDRFWIADMESMQHFTVTARLLVVSDHLYMYLDDKVRGVSADALRASAQVFDAATYPTTRRHFGSAWAPGLDGDERITVLHTRQLGAAGAFSSADEESPGGNPFSNGRHMIYINVDQLRPGTRSYDSVLAHEFQHAIHFFQDRNEDAWVNEGASMLNEQLNGYGGGQAFLDSFADYPETQLTDWGDEPDTAAHYGAAYAFLAYVYERYGDDALRMLVEEDANGAAGFDRVLERLGKRERFDDIFADWMVANMLDDPQLAGGVYGYKSLDVALPPTDRLRTLPATAQVTVPQYAAYYVELSPPQGTASVYLTATTTTRLTGNDAHSGAYQWWSNRGDLMNTSMTRAVDLSAVSTATLDFWTWFDLEDGWDYAYLLVSTDAGQTWRTLPTRHTTDDNPVGNNLGNGYTGRSGGGRTVRWVADQADLTPYAGRQIMLRFEYVTDDAVNNAGFCVDDMSISAIGWRDDAETGGAWQTNGFVRSSNTIPQGYVARLITTGAQTQVTPVIIDSQGLARIDVNGAERAILAVAGTAPITSLPVTFSYTVRTP